MGLVLNDGPWAFEGSTLVCKQVEPGVLPGDILLDSLDMWIQVHDLPFGYTTIPILEHVGNFLGQFVRMDDRFQDAPWRAFYRILVAIPVAKPLKRRMKLIKSDKSTCWVTFKYERLHTYYFCCCLLGYAYKYCLKARNLDMPVELYPYGDLRSAWGNRDPRPVGDPWIVPLG
ncbi:PREDICTED: uncharacterized protein LOC109150387 [Ipomoea nil]|uniref:uncharacterized protein LOC109150387 n=1 Tax=Ipomoea nil TaxID=35883 RepID=UPI000900CD2C|nr:PREDICTED: uncharacterized protein LOC109150387 [Ipomoea nil]